MEAAIPDYCEFIKGYRAWTAEGETLKSFHGHLSWPPYAPLKAQHLDGPWMSSAMQQTLCDGIPCVTHLPMDRPGCGIYAFRKPEILRAELRQRIRYSTRETLIIGEVALWGTIADHALGYRGEFAYPQKILAAFGLADGRKIAINYGIPYLKEEEESWKSVNRDDASLQNRSGFRSPNGYQFKGIPFQPSSRRIWTPLGSIPNPFTPKTP